MRQSAASVLFGLVTLIVAPIIPAMAEQDPPLVATTPKLSPAEESRKMQLPPGFEIQLVASEPDIHKPMNICFDDRGRLWLTDTIEYPFPAASGKTGRDRVLILEDFGPDGRARKVTTFAEGLNIPIGIHPYKDGCIVFSIPNIWFLRDTDGDGKADKKELLYGTFGQRDTHGMTNSFTIGFDGWLYACHGFLNDSVVKGSDGQELRMNSGNTYRMNRDGSHCEIFTRGQVNPFGMAWDPLGNLYTADCHSRPLTQLLRGATYESFSKPHDGLGFAPHMNEFGDEHSTGLCGIVYYTADQFPAEYQDKIFLGDVVRNRVNMYRLDYTGSTPKAVFAKFLTSQDPWFRPVDLKLGPDGAIYLADFYNRIIGHYEVPITHPDRDRDSGRIWRIVWKGADGQAKPALRPYDDLHQETIEKLGELLAHPNLTVRMQATNELVARGKPAAAFIENVLKHDAAATQVIHGLWVLERLGALDDNTLASLAGDRDRGVRVHVMRILAERAKLSAVQRELVTKALGDADPLVQRCAVEALGRHPAGVNVAQLLKLRHSIPAGDTQLLYAVRLALRNQLMERDIAAHFTNRVLADALSADDARALADVTPGVATPEAASFLLHYLQQHSENGEPLARYAQHVARYAKPDSVTALIALSRQKPQELSRELLLFHAFQRGMQERAQALPEEARGWAKELVGNLLMSSDAALMQGGAELAGSMRQASALPRLVEIAADRKLPEGPRTAALAALLALEAKQAALVGKVMTDAAESLSMRDRAARTLGTQNSAAARTELLNALPAAPAVVASAIALGLTGNRAGCEDLLKAVAEGKASPRLLQEPPIRDRLNQARLPQLNERIAKLTAGIPAADQRMNDLLRQRQRSFVAAKADAVAGAKVYEKACAICHQIGGKGTKVGPQLDGIGTRGVERLLEDIFDPNRNVDPAFRATRLTLKDGKDLQGLVLREEGEVVVMADNQGKEIRVEKKLIEERVTSPLSAMPANLADTISPEEFNHLLAFLLAQRGR